MGDENQGLIAQHLPVPVQRDQDAAQTIRFYRGDDTIIADWVRDALKRHPAVKHAARRVRALVPLSVRLGREFWAWYAFFEESEQWTADQLAAYQMERLRALLDELEESSGFYHERFSGIDLECIDTLERFQTDVPTLSRGEFRENYSAIRSRQFGRQRVVKAQTSGTTGMALQFHHSAKDNAREWAAICHQWKRVGYEPGKSRRAEFRGLTTPGKMIEVFPGQNMLRCSILHLGTPHVRRYGEEIRKHRASFYHGYASALYLLAKQICDSGIDFPQPQAILLASEAVYDWQLTQIQMAFPNAKLLAHYGCAERTVLAGWCEHRREYHVLPQYSLVEMDDVTSEIIGTNLFNTVNGFVRYRMTDIVLKTAHEPCPDCGRPYTPRLVKLGGRSEDYLYSPQHGWIPPAVVTYPLKALSVIREMQFYQKEREEIVVRYTVVPGGGDSQLRSELDHIETDLYRLFGYDMRIRFDQVDEFERSPSGKFKWIVCELEEMPSAANRSDT